MKKTIVGSRGVMDTIKPSPIVQYVRRNACYRGHHRSQLTGDACAHSNAKSCDIEEHSNRQGSNPLRRQPPPRLRVVQGGGPSNRRQQAGLPPPKLRLV